MKKRFIVIGVSAAGIGAVQKLRQLDQTAEIICIAAESSLPYNKCFLADYLGKHKVLDEVYTRPVEFFDKKNIIVRLDEKLVGIDSVRKEIITTKDTLSYDALFLATGASARNPFAIPDLDNVYLFHTLQDAQQLYSVAQQYPAAHAVVIGAGLSGMEVADSLQQHGLTITMVEQNKTVLPGLLNQDGATFLHRKMREHKVDLHLERRVDQIEYSDGKATGIVLDNGTRIIADIVIVATGVKPNLDLATSAGITCNENGIIVNEYMQTSDAGIFAGGDCVQTFEQRTKKPMRSCLWPDAMMQGLIAAHAMVGLQKPYPGMLPIISSSFFGLPFFSYGPIADDHDYTVRTEEHHDCYHAYLLDENKHLQGYLLIGNTGIQSRLRRMLLTGEPCLQQ